MATLCQKQLGCKCVDISGNELSQEKVKKFIECLEGRSHTRDVAPFFLAIGSGGQLCELLTPWSASCNPFAKHGCFCRSRKVVHVLDSLHRQPASALSKTRQLPPPPEVSPPLPPTDIIQRSLELGQARETFAAALDEEVEDSKPQLPRAASGALRATSSGRRFQPGEVVLVVHQGDEADDILAVAVRRGPRSL